MSNLRTIAKWSIVSGAAVGLFSHWGVSGILGLALVVVALWGIGEWRASIEANYWALRAHEAIAQKVEEIIKRRGK